MRRFSHKHRFFMAPLILVAVAAFGFITMYLWNWLMPNLFHLPLLTFWQAAGLLVLSRLLFGFGGGHWHGHHNQMRGNLREKWEKMSPEEREQFAGRLHHGRNPWAECCKKETNMETSESK